MGFNYKVEKGKFDEKWKRLRKKYEELGMSKEDIAVLYQGDLDEFNSNRRYIIHTRKLASENISEDNKTSMFMKFKSLSVKFDIENFSGKFYWIDTIDSEQLYRKLKKLKDDELKLLELYYLKGYKQREIALFFGCDQSLIPKKLKKIKVFLK